MNSSDASAPLWVYPQESHDWLEEIIREFRIHPITAQILVSRGFESLEKIHSYLYAKLPDLHDPKLFLEMDRAVERVIQALDQKEGILIYGDNDVDGMTGTALLADFLKTVGGRVSTYVPHPGRERDNIFLDGLAYAHEQNCSLLITVDCGITAAKEVEKMVEQKVDVIITDHHEPTDKIPHCVATLNPKLHKQSYPNRDLTGVGVAFKLAHALTNALIDAKKISRRKIDLKVYLDLVALGTIADMGALLGENRILVRYGIRQLQKTKRIGLVKLFSVCGVEGADLNTINIASKIAPRMNSLGRVADPRKGVELLLVRDEKRAEELANELDLFNLERQKVEQVVTTDVDDLLSNHPELIDQKAIVLSSSNWHPGVIPIVSARVAKQFNRPTAIIAVDEGVGKGSMRTIKEFPLLPILKKCKDLLLNFGGHDFAAGLTIREEDIEQFKKRFIHAATSRLRDEDLLPKLYLDAAASFKDLTYDLLSSLELFEPYGNENAQPVLYTEARQAWPPKVIGGSHLKLYLEQDDRMLEGIGFGMGNRASSIRKKNLKLAVAYSPQINRFQNKSSIQLLIRDFTILDS